ncbi:MAG: hypothetical protein P8170_04095 [Gemmatimonadota bacterium]
MAVLLMLLNRNALTGLILAALLLPALAGAQERVVVSKEVAVGSSSEASLRLEFSSGAPLEIAFDDGTVTIDGDAVGSFDRGGAAYAAWRNLLSEAIALENGPLSEMLVAWSPPEGLEGSARDVLETIDEALERSLRPAVEVDAPSVSVSVGSGGESRLLQALLGQVGRLSVLEEALADAGGAVQLHIQEDVEVQEGETVHGTLVVIQADARIRGTVDGDVVVVDGSLQLLPGSRVLGEVRLADADVVRNEGAVDGTVVDMTQGERDLEAEIRARLRDELRSELRDEIRQTEHRSSGGGFNPFRRIFGAVGGIVENLVKILILGLIGMGIIAFAPDNLDIVAETARRAPGRAAAVGVAGAFLLVPVWILGAVALAVSIVGIPVMIAWLPLFPLAAIVAGLLGYLAVARNVGEWLADSGYRYTEWIRKSNSVYTVFGGLIGLMSFFIVGHALSVVPLVGFVKGLLAFAGTLASLAALAVGFGAVLLTRGGRRREYFPESFDEAWERAVDVEIDVDDVDIEMDEEQPDESPDGDRDQGGENDD